MNNRPHASYSFAGTARCGAKTRKGKKCKSHAMKNGRCRMHGGMSTGPKTSAGRARCGNWIHGHYSRQAKQRQSDMSALIKRLKDSTKI